MVPEGEERSPQEISSQLEKWWTTIQGGIGWVSDLEVQWAINIELKIEVINLMWTGTVLLPADFEKFASILVI